jgi:acetylornithine deacetylase/succinyl-diaminopimelate desuccinylase-like protein
LKIRKLCDRKRLIETLRELVRIPSLSGEEAQAAEYVSKRLDQLGLTPEVDRYYNITTAMGSGRTVLINSHLDTVPPGQGWTIDPYSAKVAGGRVYGIGASDNKSGVAVMLEVARVLRQRDLKGRILFLFTSREESDKEKTREVLTRSLKADAGINLDTYIHAGMRRADVIIGCKGIMNLNLEVYGKAYHSSEPEKGVNSIHIASSFIQKFQRMHFPKMSKPLKENATASITQIKAGNWPTRIPDRCDFTINYRALPNESLKDASIRIKKIAQQTMGGRFKLSKMQSNEGYLIDPKEAIVRVARKAVKEVGFKGRVAIAKGWIDAASLYQLAGIPTIALGTLTDGQAHVPNEYEEIDDLIYGSEIVLRTALNFMNG